MKTFTILATAKGLQIRHGFDVVHFIPTEDLVHAMFDVEVASAKKAGFDLSDEDDLGCSWDALFDTHITDWIKAQES